MKRNEIVIYAIALMLVTAGYFNYTANLGDTTQTYSDELQNTNEVSTSSIENILDNDENNTTNNEDSEIGNAKLVNSNSVVDEDNNEEKDEEKAQEEKTKDYFITTKLDRDTNYADMISTYTKILEDDSISETQKSIAMKEITKITNIKNAISVCENILSTKGFENYAVLVNDDSVNVVIKKTTVPLAKDKVAQIQNIVSRELKSKIENIHITEK